MGHSSDHGELQVWVKKVGWKGGYFRKDGFIPSSARKWCRSSLITFRMEEGPESVHKEVHARRGKRRRKSGSSLLRHESRDERRRRRTEKKEKMLVSRAQKRARKTKPKKSDEFAVFVNPTLSNPITPTGSSKAPHMGNKKSKQASQKTLR